MRAAGLIAANLLREQRWLLVVLVLWVVLSSAAASWGDSRASIEDVLFFLKQQAMYGVAFTAFLASAAIHNERKSRRILAVLSKGIERREYLGGLLLGVCSASVIYCAAMALAGVVVFPRAHVPQPGSWIVIVTLLVISVLTSSIAMLFATIMPPFLAAIATAFTMGAMSVAAKLAPAASIVLPIYPLLRAILEFSPAYRLRWLDYLPLLIVALVEAGLVWLTAARVFAYRDVAVSVE